MLGYDTYEDDRSFEKKGLTGSVSRYAVDKMLYPCIILINTKDTPIPVFKIETLKQMFTTSQGYDESEFTIHLYFFDDISNTNVKIGQIMPKQVKSCLSLFENNQIEGYYDEETKLTDGYLYVLAE